jgi:hypothetical protein
MSNPNDGSILHVMNIDDILIANSKLEDAQMVEDMITEHFDVWASNALRSCLPPSEHLT